MDRARDGTFLPLAPVFEDVPRANPRRRHAYEQISEAVGSHNASLFLPCIWEAKSAAPPGVRRYDRLWKQQQSWRWNVENLMDIVAGLLECQEYFNEHDGAMVPYDPPRGVFTEPLPATVCMPIHRALLRGAKYVYINVHGYVQLTLFYQAGREVRIGAHLFILWAVKGMPRSANLTQTMHCCPRALEDAACVQPSHLTYATPSDNARDYRHRLAEFDLQHSPRKKLARRRHR